MFSFLFPKPNTPTVDNKTIESTFDKFIHWMSEGVGDFTKYSEEDISEYFQKNFPIAPMTNSLRQQLKSYIKLLKMHVTVL